MARRLTACEKFSEINCCACANNWRTPGEFGLPSAGGFSQRARELNVEAAASTSPALVVPVGSTEQHGPHLPLDTDTRIATAVARAVADRLTDRDDVPLGPRAGDRIRRQWRARGLPGHRFDRDLRPASFAGGVRPVGLSMGISPRLRQRTRGKRGGAGRRDGFASIRGSRRELVLVHRRRTPTRTPATPKPLYCYIFRRATSGPTNACPETARRWPS